MVGQIYLQAFKVYYFRVGTSDFGYFGYRGLIPELPIIISGTGVYYPKW